MKNWKRKAALLDEFSSSLLSLVRLSEIRFGYHSNNYCLDIIQKEYETVERKHLLKRPRRN